MKIVPEPLAFEWDEGNKDKNVNKHNVSNKEAEEVFKNELLLISEDTKHSHQERRFLALGRTDNERWLTLSFTIRGERIRMISVRDMSKKERRMYEEKIKTYTNI